MQLYLIQMFISESLCLPYLGNHAHKRPQFKHSQRYTDKILVEKGTEKEDCERSTQSAISSSNQRRVQMSTRTKINIIQTVNTEKDNIIQLYRTAQR